MAASASFLRRHESIVEPLSPPQQTMDGNSHSPGILSRNADMVIPLSFLALMPFPPTFDIFITSLLVDKTSFGSLVLRTVMQWTVMLIFSNVIWYYCFLRIILPNCIQKTIIPSRLRAVIDINSREMGNLLALMKLWESRSCQKVDDYRIDKDTMTRLRRFLKAMESLDLTNKIYELKGLSSHLNLVTQGLIRSPLLKAIDLIMTWRSFSDYYLHRVLQDVPSIITASELDDVKSIVVDLQSTAGRLNSRLWPPDTLFSQWESSEDAQSLINKIEETTRDIQSIVRTLQKKADLPDFGSVAVVSCWKLGVSSTTAEKVGLRPEHSPIDSKLSPRLVCQVDERELGWLNSMERVEVNDVDENGAYRGICKLCVKVTTKDETEIGYGTGWLINNSTVVTAAHNLYSLLDESYASEVEVQVGVTKGSKNVETQRGHFAAIHWGFYAAGNRQNDMAMIKLTSPFHKVVPIRYGNAPLVQTESSFLRVVGYPTNVGGIGDHQGKIMHVSQGAHAKGWDLTSTDYILRHHLDTEKGHSGCPLLKVGNDARAEAIAIHAGGYEGKGWNEAAPLGHNANDIKAFDKALRIMEDGDNARHNPGSQIEEVQDNIPGLKKVTIPL